MHGSWKSGRQRAGKLIKTKCGGQQAHGKELKVTQKYTLVKNGKTYGDYTVYMISRMLAEGQAAVREAAQTGKEIHGYTLVEAQTAENENGKRRALAEWDEIRFRLNPKARKEPAAW
ncbi:MAG: hypothetical protein NC548_51110 [Lachnospiraceae bacterium]|nr:hypothetical protein [Lachnospiraceae bacterium]